MAHPIRRMWCPHCSAEVSGDDLSGAVACPSCARPIDIRSAASAAQWWIYAAELGRYHEELDRRAGQLRAEAWAATQQAQRAAAQAREAETEAHRAMEGATTALRSARQWSLAAAGQHPGPPAAVSGDVQQPSTARPRRAIPVSLLLQGTGALLLLAAFIIASAVLWEDMGAALQAAALIGLVAVAGTFTVWMRRHLPTTSVILAVLTAATGVVVGSALPGILPGLDGPWYPVAGCAAGTLTLLFAGRISGIRFWWHAGVVGAAVTAGVGIATLLEVSELERATPQWFAAIALMGAPMSAAALLVSGSEERRDPETARTTWWLSALATGLSAAAAFFGALAWTVALSQEAVTAADRWFLVSAGLVLALLMSGTAGHVWRYDRGRPVAWLQGACAVLGALPIVLLAPAPRPPVSAVVIAASVPVALLGLAAWAGSASWRGSWTGRLAASAAAGLTGACALAATAYGFPTTDPTDLAWLLVLLWGLGIAGVAWVVGMAVRRRAWVVFAVFLAGWTWWGAWLAGYLGTALEAATLPFGALLLVSWWLGMRRGMVLGRGADPRVGQLLALGALAPSVAQAWADQEAGDVAAWRVLLEVAGLAVVAAWAGAARSGWTLPAAAVAVASLGHLWAGASALTDAAVEAFSLPVALAVGLVLAAGVRDGWTGRHTALIAGGLVAVVPSWLRLVADPAWSAQTGLRLLWVQALLVLLAALVWRWPGWAWLAGSLAALTPLWVYGAWVLDRTGLEPEALWLPAAAAASVSAALGARALGSASPAAWAIRAGLWVAVLPSAVLAFGTGIPTVDAEALRLVSILAVLGCLGILCDRQARIEAALASSGVVVLAWLLYVDWLAGFPDSQIEATTVPTAAAVSLLLGWVGRPTTAIEWWSSAIRWGALLVVGGSTVEALTSGTLPSDAWFDWLRVAAVVLAWAVGAYLAWDRPWTAAVLGSLAVVVTVTNVVSLLSSGRTDPAPELATLPTAAALGAISALIWRAYGRTGSSLLWVGPPVAMALLPTAALAWAEGTVGPRVWVGLIGGAAVLVLGVRKEWAGLVVPGLLAIGLVVAPVLLRWTTDLPVWIPLTLVGTVLFVIGARLEATRRGGHRLANWAVRLH